MIDRNYLAQQTADDVELQHELLSLLLNQLCDLDAQLGSAAADAAEISRTLPPHLHRVRGAAAAVGAAGLAAALGDAETAAMQGRLSPPQHAALRAEVAAARAELSALIAAL